MSFEIDFIAIALYIGIGTGMCIMLQWDDYQENQKSFRSHMLNYMIIIVWPLSVLMMIVEMIDAYVKKKGGK